MSNSEHTWVSFDTTANNIWGSSNSYSGWITTSSTAATGNTWQYNTTAWACVVCKTYGATSPNGYCPHCRSWKDRQGRLIYV